MQQIDVRRLIMDEAMRIGETRYIETVSVTELCERCGISRPTFYAYFTDKYDLINEIFHSTIIEAFRSMSGDSPWPLVLGKIMESIRKRKKFYMNSIKYFGQNALKDMMLTHTYRGYMLEVSARGNKDPDEKLINEIRFNAYGSTGLMLDWIRSGMNEDPYAVAGRIYSCMPETMKKYFE